eukprot:snap_masked-scaffold_70-processed-gene-0.24-mRNA-1 protein AED:1.00 eAED:1.00 QI:0/-1/0/0/-1/1/1/0/383
MVKIVETRTENGLCQKDEKLLETGEEGEFISEYVGKSEPGFFENIEKDEVEREENKKEVYKQLDQQMRKIHKDDLLEEEQWEELKKLYLEYTDVFAVGQTGRSMSHLSPMEVFIKPGDQPFNSKLHPVTGDKKKILEKKLRDLEGIGALERGPNPYFSSPAFIVPKPQKNKYRMVIDLTRLNRNTEANTGSLPHWETQFSWLPRNCLYFALFDTLSGFDMLRITPESEKYFGISTMMGVYKLKCAPMGYHSTPFIYSERTISEVLNAEEPHLFGAAEAGVLQWLDDSLLYSTSWEGFLKVRQACLDRCRKKNLRLNLLKCELVSKSPTWCGRVISKEGWAYNEKHYNKIKQIPRPVDFGHLETILHLSNWLSTSIPSYAEIRQ